MPIELGSRLIAAGLVMPEEVEAALFLSVLRGMPFMRALLDRGAIRENELEKELERGGEIAVRDVEIERTLYERLPTGMCRRFAAVPIRYEAGENMAEIAAADPFDPHIAVEFTFHLRMPVCILRAPLAAIEDALRRSDLAPQSIPPPLPDPNHRRATPPFPHGAPESAGPYPPEIPIPLTRRISLPPVAALVFPDGAQAQREEKKADDDEITVMRPLNELLEPDSTPVSSPSHALPLVRSKYVAPTAPVIPPTPPPPIFDAPAPISFPSLPPSADEEEEVMSLDDEELILDEDAPSTKPVQNKARLPGFAVSAPAPEVLARPQAQRSPTLKSPVLSASTAQAISIALEQPSEFDELPTGPWRGHEILAAAEAAAVSPDSLPTLAIESAPISADSLPTTAMDSPYGAYSGASTSFDSTQAKESASPHSHFQLASPAADPPPTRPAVPSALASAALRAGHKAPPPSRRPYPQPIPREEPHHEAPAATFAEPEAHEPTPADEQVRSLWSLLPPAAAPIAPPAPSLPLPAAPAHDIPPESSPTVAFTSDPQSLLDRPAAMPVLGQRDAPRDSSPTRTGLGEIARKIIAEHDAREAAKRAQEEKERQEAEAKKAAEIAEKARVLVDVETVLVRLKNAPTRDEVVALSVNGLESFAKRAAVFAVRKDGYRGWACNKAFGDENALREVVIPLEQPSILAAAASLAVYLGPIQNTLAHTNLISVMAHPSKEALAVAVRVANRPAMILLADEFSDVKLAKRRMEELARGISEALLRLIGHR